MYYLTTTAKRKNGKRHIVAKYLLLEDAERVAKNNINHDKYKVEIYNGKWELIREA